MAKGLASLAAFLLAGSIGVARADDKRAWAEKSFRSAKIHIEQGRYDAALSELTDAYSAFPAPALLFDIAQCHRALEECDHAIRYYQAYLEQTKDPAERKAAEDLIADCKARAGQPKSIDLFGPDEAVRVIEPDFGAALATAPAELPKVQEKVQETPAISEAPKAEAPPPPPPAVTPEPELAAVADVEEDAAFYERWWFWTAVGGAVAVIVGGTVVGVTMRGETVELPSGSLGAIDFR